MTQKWLFCDFDNTLMGTESVVMPSLLTRFNELYAPQVGRELGAEEFRANFQGQGKDVLCRNLSAYFGIDIDYPTLYANRDWQVAQHCQQVGVAMASNLIETLRALATSGWRFAIVSNNNAARCLAAMRYATNKRGEELAQLFGTHVYEAGEVQKPQGECYRRALLQTGADPAHVVAIEDSPTGVRAAVAAGLATFGYTGFAEAKNADDAALAAAGAAACFTNWAALPELLAARA